MADKRMFSSKIIDSDAFIEMSPMARLLYFNLSLHADDDGFTNSARREMKIVGAQDSDLNELVDKRFVIRFDSGVVAIKHWRINNTIRSDRYKATTYTDEKSLLTIEPNGAYTIKNDDLNVGIPTDNHKKIDGIPSDNQCVPQIRGGEDRLEEDRLGKDRLGEGCACVREESSEIQADCLTPPSNEEDVFVYFPTSKGEVPITYKDVDNLNKKYNGAVDVKAEILACAANARNKPNSTNTWEYAVACWIARTLRFKSADSVESENRKMGTRNHRSMEPGKIIEGEEAGF